jgi:hypothetical protein
MQTSEEKEIGRKRVNLILLGIDVVLLAYFIVKIVRAIAG